MLGPPARWIRPDSHHSNPQLWVNSQCRAAAMFVSGTGGMQVLQYPLVLQYLREFDAPALQS